MYQQNLVIDFPKIGKFSSWRSIFTSREGLRVQVWVGDKMASALMTIGESGVACFGRSDAQFREIPLNLLYHEL